MKQDAIWIVGGGMLQVPAVECAKKLGLKVIVSDRDVNCDCCNLADTFACIDIYDIENHIKNSEYPGIKDYNIKAIYTEGADCEVTVAALAQHLSLRGSKPEAALKCKNKAMMREFLNRDLSPQWTEVSCSDLSSYDYADHFGYPVIVKPIDNCASKGLSVVTNPIYLNNAVKQAISYSTTRTCLIEEMLFGTEHTVEILIDPTLNFKWLPINICDRYFEDYRTIGKIGYMTRIEKGHKNPSELDKKLQDKIYDIVYEASQQIGIEFGVFKCDVILSEVENMRHLKILECTNRLSGGFDSQYTQPLAYGSDPIMASMMLALGMNSYEDLILNHTKKEHSACLSIFTKDKVKMTPNVERIFTRKTFQDEIRNNSDRHTFVLTNAYTHSGCFKIEFESDKKIVEREKDA